MKLSVLRRIGMLKDVPVDYFKAKNNYDKSVHKLKPKYQKSYTLYFFAIVKDLLVNGEVDINKYSKDKVSEGTVKSKSKAGNVISKRLK